MEHIAIDLGGRESQICVRSEQGTIVDEQRVQTCALKRWLKARSPGRVIVETCAESFGVADAAILGRLGAPGGKHGGLRADGAADARMGSYRRGRSSGRGRRRPGCKPGRFLSSWFQLWVACRPQTSLNGE